LFDEKLIKGKIKSIGTFTYTWYSLTTLRDPEVIEIRLSYSKDKRVTYIVR